MKNNIKRIFAIMLVLVLVFSLSACNNTSKEGQVSDQYVYEYDDVYEYVEVPVTSGVTTNPQAPTQNNNSVDGKNDNTSSAVSSVNKKPQQSVSSTSSANQQSSKPQSSGYITEEEFDLNDYIYTGSGTSTPTDPTNPTNPVSNTNITEKLSTLGKVGIIGDSYSTYSGYIPSGYDSWYKTGGANTDTNDVSSVEETWWKLLLGEMNSTLVTNCSYSGSLISNATKENVGFITRMKAQFKGTDQIDTFFIFGGLNDKWKKAEVGEPKKDNITSEDLKKTVPALCYIFTYLKQKYPNARIITIIDTSSTHGLSEEQQSGMKAACELFGTNYIELNNISKQNGHPNVAGMKSIKNQIVACFK